ncbi:hypothetical protein APUTEX25_001352 [Auxenochlorella protothecoides]|uniref:Fructose-bisphosphate aldolase n=1 Tax=Auxenochlorella protothecoides TaxID=3075 RepID=A0A3M7L3C2_AUXPR|nr:hypothetical protein APUTEX25_001352 [Auxenochlorella protothecoides]|eukprot:RMZ56505.1 hypothetical protein APUTEX25_001352 [Auxenochlorella protothecoides]
MIGGMRMDLEKSRYETYDELYDYCYRVAGTVGLMSAPVMGIDTQYKGPLDPVYRAALSLGTANQLTNILRDVGEDAQQRSRVYLPLDELARFGISPGEVLEGTLARAPGQVDPRWAAFMRFQIERTRAVFSEAEGGIRQLSRDARWPVWSALILYRQILDAIEANGYDNFTRRAYVPKWRKLATLPSALVLAQAPWKTIASPGKGILAMDESNATCGKRLEGIGLENTVENRQTYRELLVTTPGLGEYISGLDGLDVRCGEYYRAGARFAKWRSVVSIPSGPTPLAVRDCAYGLARYAALAQSAGLVPIVEPEILLDGEHDIDRTLEVASAVWAETFKYLADNNVLFEGILLKPSMVTPGADSGNPAAPEVVADYTLRLLRRRVPPAVPGIMFLSGGQSELEATLNLNAMNQSPNPWHVSFSYARALQNSVLRTWKGEEANFEAAQKALIKRAAANSTAQRGQYDPANESEEAAKGMYEKGYTY